MKLQLYNCKIYQLHNLIIVNRTTLLCFQYDVPAMTTHTRVQTVVSCDDTPSQPQAKHLSELSSSCWKCCSQTYYATICIILVMIGCPMAAVGSQVLFNKRRLSLFGYLDTKTPSFRFSCTDIPQRPADRGLKHCLFVKLVFEIAVVQ